MSLAAIAVIGIAIVAVGFLWLRLPLPEPLRWYLVGAMDATGVMVILLLVNHVFLVHDAGAIHHVRGAWGEENTRTELEAAKRRKLIWGWVDSITLKIGDIDHLVVTRDGGVVAVDSKWRSSATPAEQERMANDARKAQLRAQAVLSTVLSRERRDHRARGAAIRVQSVVVLWGPIQADVPPNARIGDTTFVAGRKFRSWLRSLEGEPASRAAGTEILGLLERYRNDTWSNTQPRI